MIETNSIVSFAITAVAVLVASIVVFKSTKSFLIFLLNIALGMLALWVLDTVGYSIPINWITAGLIGLLGLPGVLVIVILKYVFNII